MFRKICSITTAALVMALSFNVVAAGSKAAMGQESATLRAAQPADDCRDVSQKLSRDRHMPADVKRRVMDDCAKGPSQFKAFVPRQTSRAASGSALAANSHAEGPCKKCMAYCQTITILTVSEWGSDLGGGMSPSQCADAAVDTCGSAYNSLLLSWSCSQ